MADEKAPINVVEILESIKDTPEFKTLLENTSKQAAEKHWNEKIGAEVKNIYTPFDVMVKEMLGEEKPNDVKTSDHIKAKISELKDLRDKVKNTPNTTDVTAKQKEQNDLLLAQIAALQNDLKDKDSKIADAVRVSANQLIEAKIDSALFGKTLISGLSESVLNTVKNARKKELIERYTTFDDGKVIFYKDAAKTDAYRDTLQNPLTPEAVVEAVFGDLFQVKKAGGNANPSTTPTPEGEVIEMEMGNVKSKQEAYAQFNKKAAMKGLSQSDEKFSLIQLATAKHYNFSELPYN
jgi:hypothetical protein